ncbi:MAG: hypothetical protein C0499_05425, partial [Zymomonas sp.]|nr:hypothetical protein [Zymomonas sp.]
NIINFGPLRRGQITDDPVGRLLLLYDHARPTATRFDDVGDQLITEFDASGNTTARHVFGPGDDEPVV